MQELSPERKGFLITEVSHSRVLLKRGSAVVKEYCFDGGRLWCVHYLSGLSKKCLFCSDVFL